MAKQLNITDEERKRIDTEIENFFLFTEDVVENPALLTGVPNDADIEAIPIEQREPGRRYDIETPRTVATVTPARAKPAQRTL